MGKAYELDPDAEQVSPEYVPPEKTMAALEAVALNITTPLKIAEEQAKCPEVKAHLQGRHPRGVRMETVDLSGSSL